MRRAFWSRPCSKSSRPQMPYTSHWGTLLPENASRCCALTPDPSDGAGSCTAKSHQKKNSAPLSPAEQQRLHQYVQANPTPRKIGLLLGLELGLRIGEICGLQWGDFDLKLGTLNINRTVCRISCGNGHTKVVIQTPKTRTSRREIPLPKQLLIMPKSCAEAPEILHGSFPAASPSPPNPAATGKASKEITLISPLLKWKIPLLVFLFFCRRVHNCFILC